jgi:GxxExxY protein
MFYPVLNIKISRITEAVYYHLGPGLPDNVYRECFTHELDNADILYEKDPFIPIDYKGRILDSGIYACFIIDDKIVLYIQSSSKSTEYHENQLYSYMKLSGKRCGMILDFNTEYFEDIMRIFME